MGAVRLPKILVLTIDDFVSAKSPRCWYGGAIGMIRFNGTLNTGLSSPLFCNTRIATCYPFVDSRQALISYQDYNMLLLTLSQA